MSVKVDYDPSYIEKMEEHILYLEKQLQEARNLKNDAEAETRRLRRCYEEEHQFVLDAKILKCELAECREEITRLQGIIDEFRRDSQTIS